MSPTCCEAVIDFAGLVDCLRPLLTGGKAFILLPSTAKGGSIARIMPALSPGTHVSTSKNDVDHVFTEHGVAQLRGKSARQRAGELIAIAHPAFRAELTQQVRRLNLA